MRVETNANYTVFMSSIDVDSLIQGKPVSFWIALEDHEDITFKIMKE